MPMDVADTAQEINETFLEKSLNKRRLLTVPFSGACLSCGEPVEDRRFCGPSCREEHEINLRRRMIDQTYAR